MDQLHLETANEASTRHGSARNLLVAGVAEIRDAHVRTHPGTPGRMTSTGAGLAQRCVSTPDGRASPY
jgi:hypothetical protein